MTQTEATPTQEPDEVGGHAAPPVDDHHDPLHDIDDVKTVIAVVGTLAVIVTVIWGMSHLFNVIVQVEHQEKIGNIPAVEFERIRDEGYQELAGKHPDRGTKTIDQAITEYLAK
jgi:hypothetical protein